MEKVVPGERPDWKDKAEALGFRFHTMHGEPYWDETSAYAFDLEEIETRIEAPATELHAMCVEAAGEIVASEEMMARLGVPADAMDIVAESFRRADPSLYGRLDFAYNRDGPVQLLEYNADTPTSVYEAASFQWLWLEDMIASGRLPAGSDQFNAIHDKLVERFGAIFAPDANVHFASAEGIEEDYATVEYLAWCAKEAGLVAHYTPIERIGLTTTGQFADAEDRTIDALFKLYPWEDMLRDDFAGAIPGSGCRFLEPAWKAVVSNKGILPVLWRRYEGHPNLLPAFFETEIAAGNAFVERARHRLDEGHVLKPIFGREGAGVEIIERGVAIEASRAGGYKAHPRIVQAYAPLPVFEGMRPVLGAWIVGRAECVGMGIRDDASRITQDLSRFRPHYIVA